jgi:hypothetical protein
MANSGGLITAPVSIQDVRQVLGNSSTDLGTLCKASQINMWAKYKPILYPKVGIMTDSDFATDMGAGTSYRITWGIKRKASFIYSDFEENGTIKTEVWTWNKPTGGSASPYRLADFNGYYQRAVPPIEIHLDSSSYMLIPSEPTASGSIMSFVFEFGNAVSGWYSDKCISIGTFFTSTELGYYPTIQMICKINNTVKRYAVSADKTVQQFINSGNPMGQVLVDTQKMKNVFSSDSSMNDGAEWTACLIITPSRYTGEAGSYEINSGSIGRLEYAAGVDRKSYTVKNTTVVDKIGSLSYTATVAYNSSTGRYYVQSIYATATKSGTTDAIPMTIEITITCVGGTIIGGSPTGNKIIVSDSFDMPQGSSPYSKTYSGSALTTPEYYWTSEQSSHLGGHKPLNFDVKFTPGSGYGSLSGSVSIDCSTSTLSATKVIK